MKQRTSKILLILALLMSTVYVNNNLMSQSLTTNNNTGLQKLHDLVNDASVFVRYINKPVEREQALQSITELVDKQSSKNLRIFRSFEQKPLLHFAISQNYRPLIKKLINKVDINETYNNQTPLEYLNPAHQSDIIKTLILAGADINKLGSYRKFSPQEYIAELLNDAQKLDDSESNSAAKENLNEAYNIYNALITLKNSFDNNVSFNTIEKSIDPNYIELFIINTLMKDPYTIDKLSKFFKDINILEVIQKYKDVAPSEKIQMLELITRLYQEILNTNPDLLKAILTGQNIEKYKDTPEVELYQLAQQSKNKKLGRLIRKWA